MTLNTSTYAIHQGGPLNFGPECGLHRLAYIRVTASLWHAGIRLTPFIRKIFTASVVWLYPWLLLPGLCEGDKVGTTDCKIKTAHRLFHITSEIQIILNQ